jgi:hypothetical protein
MTWLLSAIVAGVIIAVLNVIIGRIRHEPQKTIVLNAIGYPRFLIGLGAAAEVSVQAFWAAGAASQGTLLFTMAHDDRRNLFLTSTSSQR